MNPVSLDIVPPGAALEDYVSAFFEFRSSLPQFDDLERADIGQIRFMLAGHGHGRFVDGTVQNTTRVFILGPTTGPLAITLYGPVLVFGVSLLPPGWAALARVDASLLTNRIVDASDVYGPRIFELADALAAAPDLAARTALFGAFVEDAIASDAGQGTAFMRTVNRWLETAFSPDVAMLAQLSGLSRRQIERNCKRYYGVPPKMLARKYRALRAAIMLARGEASVEDCVSSGFYDQSHLIREIKHFTGTTPGAIPAEMSVLARLTLQNADHIDRIDIGLTDRPQATIC